MFRRGVQHRACNVIRNPSYSSEQFPNASTPVRHVVTGSMPAQVELARFLFRSEAGKASRWRIGRSFPPSCYNKFFFQPALRKGPVIGYASQRAA
jgi:hypothetical protein